MSYTTKTISIVISVALQDAGEATRSLEIAKCIRKFAPIDITPAITFFSHGSKFEQTIISNGFSIHPVAPSMEGNGPHADLKMGKNNFVGSVELAYKLLQGELDALHEIHPDIVIFGFWPFASIARRMLKHPIPGICFLPIPMEPTLYASFLMKDIPDMLQPLSKLPATMRLFLMRHIPKQLKLKAPILRQNNLRLAIQQSGWTNKAPSNLFDMISAELTIVNDLPIFYKDASIPSSFKIVGPLFAPGSQSSSLDENILRVFDSAPHVPNIFCTMGSSGSKDLLFEAIQGIVAGAMDWNAVILAPSCICSLDEARAYAVNCPNIFITDQFVPAPIVNRMADIVVSHGGQGTIQTAISSGTPVVGVAMQPEQQINLENLVEHGAGIRIQKHRWNAKAINLSIKKVLLNKAYKENMLLLQHQIDSIDGGKNSAIAVWTFINQQISSGDKNESK